MLARLTDQDLLSELLSSATRLRQDETTLLVYLAEVDRRRLYAGLGFSSMFDYCVEVLKFSEGTTCRRLKVARAAASHPEILATLREGQLNLTALSLLTPHLTTENATGLLTQARGLRTRDVEKLVANLAPKADLPDSIKKGRTPLSEDCMPLLRFASAPGGDSIAVDKSAKPSVDASRETPRKQAETIKPSAPQRYHIKLTAGEELARLIELGRDLLAREYPEGRLEDVLLEAMKLLVARKTKADVKPAARARPADPRSRRFHAKVERTLRQEDHLGCSFVGQDGRRCGSRRWLETDHVQPWALGGRSDDVANGQRLCRTHNQWRSDQTFGQRENKQRAVAAGTGTRSLFPG